MTRDDTMTGRWRLKDDEDLQRGWWWWAWWWHSGTLPSGGHDLRDQRLHQYSLRISSLPSGFFLRLIFADHRRQTLSWDTGAGQTDRQTHSSSWASALRFVLYPLVLSPHQHVPSPVSFGPCPPRGHVRARCTTLRPLRSSQCVLHHHAGPGLHLRPGHLLRSVP